mmetsp:Transcript_2283/g.6189  ORF Transcript_2283/g.6189 Transcript_2283/m.6189 type:complete len:139 (+) Transcript_2283:488-904(+)
MRCFRWHFRTTGSAWRLKATTRRCACGIQRRASAFTRAQAILVECGRWRSRRTASGSHRAASGSIDNTVRLWNPSTGEYLRTCLGHSSYVNALAFSPDGTLLASGSRDRTVRLWNLAVGIYVRACEGHSDWVNAVAFE